QKIDNEIGQVTQQLAQADQQLFENTGVSRTIPKQAMITIIDDDTYAKVYSILRVIASDYGIPISCATITGNIGKSEFLTLAQMHELKDNYGFEFLSHTKFHARLHE